MNNELDNYPVNFVHQKAATPPSTNPGSATDTEAQMSDGSSWPDHSRHDHSSVLSFNTDSSVLAYLYSTASFKQPRQYLVQAVIRDDDFHVT